MPGIRVGEGFVEVHANMDAVPQEVAASESRSAPAASRAGEGIGKTLVKGAMGAFAGLKLGELISGSVDASAVQANLQARLTGTSKVVAAKAGKAAGEVFASGYGDSMDEVNDSIVAIQDNLGGLEKFSSKQTKNMSKDALTIANVYGQDVNEVIRTAGGLMKNGLAKNADEAFDIISSGMANGLNNSDELLDSLNEYAEPLSAIGLDGPAALGAFKRSMDAGGFSIDKAGDAINEFATRSIDGSKSSAVAYKSLGLDADDMMERIAKGGKSAKDATHEVISRLGGMKDQVEQDATGVALFGSMWEDAGKKTILALDPAKGAIEGVKGSTDKMSDASTSAQTKVDQMSRSVDQWKNSLIQTSGPVGDVTAVLGTMGPEGIAAGAGVITASKGIGEMAVGAGRSAKAAGLFTKSLILTKIPMAATAVATGIATAAQWAFNSAILANPITWIIVGIVALIAIIVLLIANWDTVVKFITDTWSKFMAWIQPALAAVGKWWSGLWSGVKSFVTKTWGAVTSWVSSKFTALKTGLVAIGSAINSWWSNLWNGVKSRVVSIATGLVTWVLAKITALKTGLGVIGSAISKWWSGLWNGVASVGRSIVGGVSNAIRSSFNAIVGTARNAYNGVTGAFRSMLGWLGGLPSAIGSRVSGMWNGILSGFRGVINGVVRMWNGLSFTVPGVEVFGHKIGGFTLNTPNLPYFEKGTNYFGGGPAIVGENGPEIVNLPKGSSVTPNGPTERALGGGTVTHVTNNTITINEAEDPLGSAGRVDKVLRKWDKK